MCRKKTIIQIQDSKGQANMRKLKQTMKSIHFLSVATLLALCVVMTSCDDDDDDNTNTIQPVTLNCVKPDFLHAGDKVALISPSYFTPMETV